MILVFGATGTVGNELISILSGDDVPAIAVTRGPAPPRPRRGVRWVQADLAAPASVEGLFSGVRSMFLLTGNHPDMARLQMTAIGAAGEGRRRVRRKAVRPGRLRSFPIAHRSRPL